MDVIVFWGLYIAGFQVQIASFVRVLMISTFTVGVMWQALSSRDNAVELTAMLMLPHRRRKFVFSYVGMLGAYLVLTKTGLLFAVLLAVSAWKPVELVGMILCMIHVLLAGAASAWLVLLYVLLVLLVVEIAILLFICRRHPK